MNHELVVIHWESRLTGYRGHGFAIPHNVAIDAIRRADLEFPFIRHWMEPA